MKSKTVIRYSCDFCRKRMFQRPAMERHEKHCTLNPNRQCRMCDILGNDNSRIAEFVAMLPAYAPTLEDNYADRVPAAIEAAMPVLRELANGCPMCILAALRQKKIPVPLVRSFDFKAEKDGIWSDVNAERNANISCRAE